jgi:hypothetical protein
MRIPDWLVILSTYAALLAVAGFLVWMVAQIADIYDLLRRRRLFTDDLKASLGLGDPTWDQVVDFAKLRGVSQGDTHFVVRTLVRDILTGKDANLKEKLQLLEGYSSSHRASEPFEGMPNEIRIHLERLKELGTSAEQILEPLTSQIRDLLAIKSKEYSRQKLYTVGGLVVGVVGLVFAGYTYIFPPATGSASSPEPQASSHAEK